MTKYVDKNGLEIKAGDYLRSDNGYILRVIAGYNTEELHVLGQSYDPANESDAPELCLYEITYLAGRMEKASKSDYDKQNPNRQKQISS